ncbi:MAG TPA: S9 family peptidase, partial [Micromonospora sp.]
MNPRADDADDRFLWLEEIESAAATEWVHARNALTFDRLTGGPRFAELRTAIRQVLDAADRIPYPGWRGGYFYNFWQDAEHPRGLWRRTTPDHYRHEDPEWDVLIDLDALAAAEGENWVWEGVAVRRPADDRCLVSLSRGGADAVVVREFDLQRREFVADGFALPEAKSTVSWIDRDHIWVGTDFGPDSLTASGYPRIAKRWRRGTPLAEAETVFEGRHSDVSVGATHDTTVGYERDFVGRSLDFYHGEDFLLAPTGELLPIGKPSDAGWDVHRDWLTIRLRSPWTVDGTTYPAGALLVTRFDDFVAGGRELTVLFEPDEHTSLCGYAWTRNHLILDIMDDVRSRLEVLTPSADGTAWRREPLAGATGFDQIGIVDTDPEQHDEFLLSVTGFLRPDTLQWGRVAGPVETLKRAPA